MQLEHAWNRHFEDSFHWPVLEIPVRTSKPFVRSRRPPPFLAASTDTFPSDGSTGKLGLASGAATTTIPFPGLGGGLSMLTSGGIVESPTSESLVSSSQGMFSTGGQAQKMSEGCPSVGSKTLTGSVSTPTPVTMTTSATTLISTTATGDNSPHHHHYRHHRVLHSSTSRPEGEGKGRGVGLKYIHHIRDSAVFHLIPQEGGCGPSSSPCVIDPNALFSTRDYVYRRGGSSTPSTNLMGGTTDTLVESGFLSHASSFASTRGSSSKTPETGSGSSSGIGGPSGAHPRQNHYMQTEKILVNLDVLTDADECSSSEDDDEDPMTGDEGRGESSPANSDREGVGGVEVGGGDHGGISTSASGGNFLSHQEAMSSPSFSSHMPTPFPRVLSSSRFPPPHAGVAASHSHGGASGSPNGIPPGRSTVVPPTLCIHSPCTFCTGAGLPVSMDAAMGPESDRSMFLPGLPERLLQSPSWTSLGRKHSATGEAESTITSTGTGVSSSSMNPVDIHMPLVIDARAPVAFVGIFFHQTVKVYGPAFVFFIACSFARGQAERFSKRLIHRAYQLQHPTRPLSCFASPIRHGHAGTKLDGGGGGMVHRLGTNHSHLSSLGKNEPFLMDAPYSYNTHKSVYSQTTGVSTKRRKRHRPALTLLWESKCFFYQSDIHGGPCGYGIICYDHSLVRLLDSSFLGPTMFMAAIELHDVSHASLCHANISVMGCGIVLLDNTLLTLTDSMIERCGLVALMATGSASCEISNCGLEMSGSGTNVALSGMASCKTAGSTICLRLPHLFFSKPLHTSLSETLGTETGEYVPIPHSSLSCQKPALTGSSFTFSNSSGGSSHGHGSSGVPPLPPPPPSLSSSPPLSPSHSTPRSRQPTLTFHAGKVTSEEELIEISPTMVDQILPHLDVALIESRAYYFECSRQKGMRRRMLGWGGNGPGMEEGWSGWFAAAGSSFPPLFSSPTAITQEELTIPGPFGSSSSPVGSASSNAMGSSPSGYFSKSGTELCTPAVDSVPFPSSMCSLPWIRPAAQSVVLVDESSMTSTYCEYLSQTVQERYGKTEIIVLKKKPAVPPVPIMTAVEGRGGSREEHVSTPPRPFPPAPTPTTRETSPKTSSTPTAGTTTSNLPPLTFGMIEDALLSVLEEARAALGWMWQEEREQWWKERMASVPLQLNATLPWGGKGATVVSHPSSREDREQEGLLAGMGDPMPAVLPSVGSSSGFANASSGSISYLPTAPPRREMEAGRRGGGVEEGGIGQPGFSSSAFTPSHSLSYPNQVPTGSYPPSVMYPPPPPPSRLPSLDTTSSLPHIRSEEVLRFFSPLCMAIGIHPTLQWSGSCTHIVLRDAAVYSLKSCSMALRCRPAPLQSEGDHNRLSLSHPQRGPEGREVSSPSKITTTMRSSVFSSREGGLGSSLIPTCTSYSLPRLSAQEWQPPSRRTHLPTDPEELPDTSDCYTEDGEEGDGGGEKKRTVLQRAGSGLGTMLPRRRTKEGEATPLTAPPIEPRKGERIEKGGEKNNDGTHLSRILFAPVSPSGPPPKYPSFSVEPNPLQASLPLRSSNSTTVMTSLIPYFQFRSVAVVADYAPKLSMTSPVTLASILPSESSDARHGSPFFAYGLGCIPTPPLYDRFPLAKLPHPSAFPAMASTSCMEVMGRSPFSSPSLLPSSTGVTTTSSSSDGSSYGSGSGGRGRAGRGGAEEEEGVGGTVGTGWGFLNSSPSLSSYASSSTPGIGGVPSGWDPRRKQWLRPRDVGWCRLRSKMNEIYYELCSFYNTDASLTRKNLDSVLYTRCSESVSDGSSHASSFPSRKFMGYSPSRDAFFLTSCISNKPGERPLPGAGAGGGEGIPIESGAASSSHFPLPSSSSGGRFQRTGSASPLKDPRTSRSSLACPSSLEEFLKSKTMPMPLTGCSCCWGLTYLTEDHLEMVAAVQQQIQEAEEEEKKKQRKKINAGEEEAPNEEIRVVSFPSFPHGANGEMSPEEEGQGNKDSRVDEVKGPATGNRRPMGEEEDGAVARHATTAGGVAAGQRTPPREEPVSAVDPTSLPPLPSRAGGRPPAPVTGQRALTIVELQHQWLYSKDVPVLPPNLSKLKDIREAAWLKVDEGRGEEEEGRPPACIVSLVNGTPTLPSPSSLQDASSSVKEGKGKTHGHSSSAELAAPKIEVLAPAAPTKYGMGVPAVDGTLTKGSSSSFSCSYLPPPRRHEGDGQREEGDLLCVSAETGISPPWTKSTTVGAVRYDPSTVYSHPKSLDTGSTVIGVHNSVYSEKTDCKTCSEKDNLIAAAAPAVRTPGPSPPPSPSLPQGRSPTRMGSLSRKQRRASERGRGNGSPLSAVVRAMPRHGKEREGDGLNGSKTGTSEEREEVEERENTPPNTSSRLLRSSMEWYRSRTALPGKESKDGEERSTFPPFSERSTGSLENDLQEPEGDREDQSSMYSDLFNSSGSSVVSLPLPRPHQLHGLEDLELHVLLPLYATARGSVAGPSEKSGESGGSGLSNIADSRSRANKFLCTPEAPIMGLESSSNMIHYASDHCFCSWRCWMENTLVLLPISRRVHPTAESAAPLASPVPITAGEKALSSSLSSRASSHRPFLTLSPDLMESKTMTARMTIAEGETKEPTGLLLSPERGQEETVTFNNDTGKPASSASTEAKDHNYALPFSSIPEKPLTEEGTSENRIDLLPTTTTATAMRTAVPVGRRQSRPTEYSGTMGGNDTAVAFSASHSNDGPLSLSFVEQQKEIQEAITTTGEENREGSAGDDAPQKKEMRSSLLRKSSQTSFVSATPSMPISSGIVILKVAEDEKEKESQEKQETPEGVEDHFPFDHGKSPPLMVDIRKSSSTVLQSRDSSMTEHTLMDAFDSTPFPLYPSATTASWKGHHESEDEEEVAVSREGDPLQGHALQEEQYLSPVQEITVVLSSPSLASSAMLSSPEDPAADTRPGPREQDASLPTEKMEKEECAHPSQEKSLKEGREEIKEEDLETMRKSPTDFTEEEAPPEGKGENDLATEDDDEEEEGDEVLFSMVASLQRSLDAVQQKMKERQQRRTKKQTKKARHRPLPTFSRDPPPPSFTITTISSNSTAPRTIASTTPLVSSTITTTSGRTISASLSPHGMGFPEAFTVSSPSTGSGSAQGGVEATLRADVKSCGEGHSKRTPEGEEGSDDGPLRVTPSRSLSLLSHLHTQVPPVPIERMGAHVDSPAMNATETLHLAKVEEMQARREVAAQDDSYSPCPLPLRYKEEDTENTEESKHESSVRLFLAHANSPSSFSSTIAPLVPSSLHHTTFLYAPSHTDSVLKQSEMSSITIISEDMKTKEQVLQQGKMSAKHLWKRACDTVGNEREGSSGAGVIRQRKVKKEENKEGETLTEPQEVEGIPACGSLSGMLIDSGAPLGHPHPRAIWIRAVDGAPPPPPSLTPFPSPPLTATTLPLVPSVSSLSSTSIPNTSAKEVVNPEMTNEKAEGEEGVEQKRTALTRGPIEASRLLPSSSEDAVSEGSSKPCTKTNELLRASHVGGNACDKDEEPPQSLDIRTASTVSLHRSSETTIPLRSGGEIEQRSVCCRSRDSTEGPPHSVEGKAIRRASILVSTCETEIKKRSGVDDSGTEPTRKVGKDEGNLHKKEVVGHHLASTQEGGGSPSVSGSGRESTAHVAPYSAYPVGPPSEKEMQKTEDATHTTARNGPRHKKKEDKREAASASSSSSSSSSPPREAAHPQRRSPKRSLRSTLPPPPSRPTTADVQPVRRATTGRSHPATYRSSLSALAAVATAALTECFTTSSAISLSSTVRSSTSSSSSSSSSFVDARRAPPLHVSPTLSSLHSSRKGTASGKREHPQTKPQNSTTKTSFPTSPTNITSKPHHTRATSIQKGAAQRKVVAKADASFRSSSPSQDTQRVSKRDWKTPHNGIVKKGREERCSTSTSSADTSSRASWSASSSSSRDREAIPGPSRSPPPRLHSPLHEASHKRRSERGSCSPRLAPPPSLFPHRKETSRERKTMAAVAEEEVEGRPMKSVREPRWTHEEEKALSFLEREALKRERPGEYGKSDGKNSKKGKRNAHRTTTAEGDEREIERELSSFPVSSSPLFHLPPRVWGVRVIRELLRLHMQRTPLSGDSSTYGRPRRHRRSHARDAPPRNPHEWEDTDDEEREVEDEDNEEEEALHTGTRATRVSQSRAKKRSNSATADHHNRGEQEQKRRSPFSHQEKEKAVKKQTEMNQASLVVVETPPPPSHSLAPVEKPAKGLGHQPRPARHHISRTSSSSTSCSRSSSRHEKNTVEEGTLPYHTHTTQRRKGGRSITLESLEQSSASNSVSSSLQVEDQRVDRRQKKKKRTDRMRIPSTTSTAAPSPPPSSFLNSLAMVGGTESKETKHRGKETPIKYKRTQGIPLPTTTRPFPFADAASMTSISSSMASNREQGDLPAPQAQKNASFSPKKSGTTDKMEPKEEEHHSRAAPPPPPSSGPAVLPFSSAAVPLGTVPHQSSRVWTTANQRETLDEIGWREGRRMVDASTNTDRVEEGDEMHHSVPLSFSSCMKTSSGEKPVGTSFPLGAVAIVQEVQREEEKEPLRQRSSLAQGEVASRVGGPRHDISQEPQWEMREEPLSSSSAVVSGPPTRHTGRGTVLAEPSALVPPTVAMTAAGGEAALSGVVSSLVKEMHTLAALAMRSTSSSSSSSPSPTAPLLPGSFSSPWEMEGSASSPSFPSFSHLPSTRSHRTGTWPSGRTTLAGVGSGEQEAMTPPLASSSCVSMPLSPPREVPRADGVRLSERGKNAKAKGWYTQPLPEHPYWAVSSSSSISPCAMPSSTANSGRLLTEEGKRRVAPALSPPLGRPIHGSQQDECHGNGRDDLPRGAPLPYFSSEWKEEEGEEEDTMRKKRQHDTILATMQAEAEKERLRARRYLYASSSLPPDTSSIYSDLSVWFKHPLFQEEKGRVRLSHPAPLQASSSSHRYAWEEDAKGRCRAAPPLSSPMLLPAMEREEEPRRQTSFSSSSSSSSSSVPHVERSPLSYDGPHRSPHAHRNRASPVPPPQSTDNLYASPILDPHRKGGHPSLSSFSSPSHPPHHPPCSSPPVPHRMQSTTPKSSSNTRHEKHQEGEKRPSSRLLSRSSEMALRQQQPISPGQASSSSPPCSAVRRVIYHKDLNTFFDRLQYEETQRREKQKRLEQMYFEQELGIAHREAGEEDTTRRGKERKEKGRGSTFSPRSRSVPQGRTPPPLLTERRSEEELRTYAASLHCSHKDLFLATKAAALSQSPDLLRIAAREKERKRGSSVSHHHDLNLSASENHSSPVVRVVPRPPPGSN